MVLIAVVALYLAEYIASTNARSAMLGAGQERLVAVAQSRAAEISQRLNSARADLKAKANNPVMVDAVRSFIAALPPDVVSAQSDRDIGRRAELLRHPPYSMVYRRYHRFFETHVSSHAYENLFIVSPLGQVVYAVSGDRVSEALDAGAPGAGNLRKVFSDLNRTAGQGGSVSVLFSDDSTLDPTKSAVMAASIRSNASPRAEGVVILQIGSQLVEHIAQRPEGLGRTGTVSVLRSDRRAIAGEDIVLGDWMMPSDQVDALLRRGGVASLRTQENQTYMAAIASFSFDGEVFSVVARQRDDEILAPAQRLRRETLRDGVPALALVSVLGVMLARSISVPLHQVGKSMTRVAKRQYDVTIPGRNRADEIGSIARRLDLFRASLLKADAVERENAFKSAAFEGASAALMILDTHFTIIYVNDRLVDLMSQHHVALGRNVWDFRPDALPGRNLSTFFPGAHRFRKTAEEGRRQEEKPLAMSI